MMARLTRPRVLLLSFNGVSTPPTGQELLRHAGIMDEIGGLLRSLLARRNRRIRRTSRSVSITCRTGCCRVQHRHVAIAGRGDGGKTHRRSMGPSNEFRCRDYLWDRCRPERRRRLDGISRRVPRRTVRKKNTRKDDFLTYRIRDSYPKSLRD